MRVLNSCRPWPRPRASTLSAAAAAGRQSLTATQRFPVPLTATKRPYQHASSRVSPPPRIVGPTHCRRHFREPPPPAVCNALHVAVVAKRNQALLPPRVVAATAREPLSPRAVIERRATPTSSVAVGRCRSAYRRRPTRFAHAITTSSSFCDTRKGGIEL